MGLLFEFYQQQLIAHDRKVTTAYSVFPALICQTHTNTRHSTSFINTSLHSTDSKRRLCRRKVLLKHGAGDAARSVPCVIVINQVEGVFLDRLHVVCRCVAVWKISMYKCFAVLRVIKPWIRAVFYKPEPSVSCCNAQQMLRTSAWYLIRLNSSTGLLRHTHTSDLSVCVCV